MTREVILLLHFSNWKFLSEITMKIYGEILGILLNISGSTVSRRPIQIYMGLVGIGVLMLRLN